VSRFIHCYAECHYAECRYAECRGTHLEAMLSFYKIFLSTLPDF
jgi:hypothetical protein